MTPLNAATASPSEKDAERELADADRAHPRIRSREERRDGPWVGDEQPSVGTRQAAQILRPVVRWRLGLEAAQDPIQERVDEVVLGGEVVVQRHRRGAEVTGDGPHGEGVEPLRRDGLGGVEDDFGCE